MLHAIVLVAVGLLGGFVLGVIYRDTVHNLLVKEFAELRKEITLLRQSIKKT